jgi:hypothetical protein
MFIDFDIVFIWIIYELLTYFDVNIFIEMLSKNLSKDENDDKEAEKEKQLYNQRERRKRKKKIQRQKLSIARKKEDDRLAIERRGNKDCSVNGSLAKITSLESYKNIIIASGNSFETLRKPLFKNRQNTLHLDILDAPAVDIVHNISRYFIDDRLCNSFDNILMEFCPYTIFAHKYFKDIDHKRSGHFYDYDLIPMFWTNLVFLMKDDASIIFNNFLTLSDKFINNDNETHIHIFEQKLEDIGIYVQKFERRCVKLNRIELRIHINVARSLRGIHKEQNKKNKKLKKIK